MRNSIVWFENDLRLKDNPALYHAFEKGDPVIPVFIWDPARARNIGAGRKWWLHHSLLDLKKSIERRGNRLIIRSGDSFSVLRDLVRETQARSIFWNQRHEPDRKANDLEIGDAFQKMGVECAIFESTILHNPYETLTAGGQGYVVFTPFYKNFTSNWLVHFPLPSPGHLLKTDFEINTQSVASLGLLSRGGGPANAWTPGEKAAGTMLDEFVSQSLFFYADLRDRPDQHATSRLSPYLANGELSAAQVWTAILDPQDDDRFGPSIDLFQKQMTWREFAYHLLHYFPQTTTRPLDPKFEEFQWEENDENLERWKTGNTGYPIVDAGMRQLESTGWMHNRARMIVASFLTKDLLVNWQEGAAWFQETLVDADLANNTMGWQWSAGCGADPQPYFRIFNPVLQGKRFDSTGHYVRKWIPALERMPVKYIHEPWTAPSQVLEEAGVVLGKNYPLPIIDHAFARERALGRFARASHSRQ